MLLSDTQSDSSIESRIELPLAVLNASAITRSDVAAILTTETRVSLIKNGVDNERDTWTLNYPLDRPILRLTDAFQSKYHSIVYVLNVPDGGKESARTKLWTSDILKSMQVSSQVANEIVEMSEHHCFRGVMIFNKVGSTTLSLFIWNAEVIDSEEVTRAGCLFDAFISKANIVLTSPDQAGRRFLDTCD